MRLGEPLSRERFAAVRRRLSLEHCKWDAQVGDHTALCVAPLWLTRSEWQELASLSEQLFRETLAAEHELLERPELHALLAVPKRLQRLLRRPSAPSAARVMRFDLHPTAQGFRLSEVNSDVPGGFIEATHWTRLVAAEVEGAGVAGDPTASVTAALRAAAERGPVGLLSAPGFTEDLQVVAHLARELRRVGAEAELVTLEELTWSRGRAWLGERELGAIFRFFQGEWLASMPAGWEPLFVGATPVTNPASSVLTESKRFPLVWERLSTPLPLWRRLLPETRELRDAPWETDDGWLLKSAFCNNGDTVSIRAALPAKEWRRRAWRARFQPRAWVAQRRFEVTPVLDAGGAWYPCLGVYVIDGVVAGAYARLTRGAVIDFSAFDAALLLE